MTFSPATISFIQTCISLTSPLWLAAFVWLGTKAYSVADKWLGMKFTATQSQTVHDAARTAAGHFVALLASGAAHLSDVHTANPVIIALAAAARMAIPDAADHMDTQIEDMVRLVVGQIGAMISADNTIPTIPAPTLAAVTPVA
jgi:hypothetical protein